MEERRSKMLDCNYLTVNGYYLTDTGVLLKIDDIKGKTQEEVLALYTSKLKEKLYDYQYTKSTGFIRARRDAVVHEETPTETIKEDRELPAMHDFLKPRLKAPSIVSVIRAVMLAVGVGAMIISMFYTREALTAYIPPFFATLFSITMITFATAAFEAIVLFWKKGTRAFSVMFCFLWVFVTCFTMVSTMGVNFASYNAKNTASLEQNKEANSGRLQLDSLTEKKNLKNKAIAQKEADITAYSLQEKQTAWRLSQMKSELTKLNSELEQIINAELDIKKNSPDSYLTKNTRKQTFYDYLGPMLGVPADLLQFIISILPALFNDLIAPFSVAISIFLTEKKEEKKA